MTDTFWHEKFKKMDPYLNYQLMAFKEGQQSSPTCKKYPLDFPKPGNSNQVVASHTSISTQRL